MKKLLSLALFSLIAALPVLAAEDSGENLMVGTMCSPTVQNMNFNITCSTPAGGPDPNLLTHNIMSSVIIGNKAGAGITAEGDSVFIGNYSGHAYAGSEGYYE